MRPRAEIEADLVVARARVAALEQELAFPDAQSTLVIGVPGAIAPVRVIKSPCELFEVVTGMKCSPGCRHRWPFAPEAPVVVYPLASAGGDR